jgi:hypothetical protein
MFSIAFMLSYVIFNVFGLQSSPAFGVAVVVVVLYIVITCVLGYQAFGVSTRTSNGDMKHDVDIKEHKVFKPTTTSYTYSNEKSNANVAATTVAH